MRQSAQAVTACDAQPAVSEVVEVGDGDLGDGGECFVGEERLVRGNEHVGRSAVIGRCLSDNDSIERPRLMFRRYLERR